MQSNMGYRGNETTLATLCCRDMKDIDTTSSQFIVLIQSAYLFTRTGPQSEPGLAHKLQSSLAWPLCLSPNQMSI